MKKTWQSAIAVLLMLAWYGVLPGGQGLGRSQEAVAWLPSVVEAKGDAATARSWERQLRAIESIIKATPVFGDLKGHYPLLTIKVAPPPPGGNGPWEGYLAFHLWTPPYVIFDPGGKPTLRTGFDYNYPGGIWIGINSPRDLSHWHGGEDQVGRFYVLRKVRREIAGFPAFGDRFFITSSGKPPFDPLPLERALRWIIGSLKGQVKADEDGLAASKRAYEEFMSPAGLE